MAGGCDAWGPNAYRLARALKKARVISGSPCLDNDPVSLGDTPATARGPYAALLEQVNRFTGSAAGTHKFADQPFDLASGNLSSDAAYTALLIYQSALLTAQAKIADTGTAALLTAANAAFANASATIAFVIYQQAKITNAIGGYADALGLSAWPPSAITGALGAMGVPLLIGGALLALWLLNEGG